MEEDIEELKKRAFERLKSVEPRNYWNTSGAGKDTFPEKPDPKSIPKKTKEGRIPTEPENPWWIDSEEDMYDFWVWLDRNSTPDGKMESMQQAEIAKLLGCSPTKIHFIIKEAIQKLKDNNLHYILLEHMGEDPSGEAITINAADYDSDDSDFDA